MYKKYYLIMISGGLGSTGLLYKLLEENKDNKDVCICGHFVNIPATNNRTKAEYRAIRRILKKVFLKYPRFEFSSSRFSYNWKSYKEADVIVAGFHGAYIAKNIMLRHYNTFNEWPEVIVYQGTDQDEWPEEERDDWSVRWETEKAVFDASFKDFNILGIKPPIISLPFLNTTRKEIVEYIPKDILKLMWSCRTPYEVDGEYVPCGVCKQCVFNKEIGVI